MKHKLAFTVPPALQKILVVLLSLSFAIPIVFNQILDVDIWWHLQLGRTSLANLGFPDLNQFYFSHLNDTSGVYRYTLLGDVILFIVHRIGGDIGLQFFGALLLLLAGFSLWGMAKPKGPFLLLATLVFVATTYQLQIMRNAIFGLPLFCFLLRFWWEARWQKRERAWWLIAPLLTLWSFLHGSYLVGFGIFGLIFLGDVLDQVKTGSLNQLPWRPYFANIMVATMGVAIFNPLTFQLARRIFQGLLPMLALLALFALVVVGIWFYRKGWVFSAERQRKWAPAIIGVMLSGFLLSFLLYFRRFFGRDLNMTGIDLLSPGTATAPVNLGFLGRVKFGLNNLFWKTAEEDYFSSDFLSPFDGLNEIYIWLTLCLGLFTLGMLVYKRVFALTWLLPFLATMIFALGYKRMVGYWALFSLFLLAEILRNHSPKLPLASGLAWLGSLALWLFFWGGFGLQLWDPGLRSYHFVGLGRGPMFSEQAANDLLENHPQEDIFNTVANGGFILSQWYPHKKIFIDGFFAPHRGTPLKAYQSILFGGDPDQIARRLGLKVAIVNLYDLKWFLLFNRAPNWYPEAIDNGMVVFVYEQYFRNPVPDLRVYCDVATLKKLPPSYRRMVANRLFQLQTGYLLKGRIPAAQALRSDHPELFEILPAYADDRIREESDRNLAMAINRYGEADNIWLPEEYRYQEALSQGNQLDVRKYGSKIFNAFPKRFELAFVLVGAALNAKHLSETKRYLLALDRAQGEDPDFFKKRQSQIAEMRYRAARLMRDQGQLEESFQQLEKAHQLAPKRFNKDVFFNDTLDLYERLLEKGKPVPAYQLLIKLEFDFPDNPFIQHLLAITVRKHNKALNLPLTSALKYGQKALELAKDQSDVPIEALRENIALIHEAMGNPEEAEKFRAQR